MVDYEKKEIKDGDFLIECDEETAELYEVINGKPEYFADWNHEYDLNLVNNKNILKSLNKLPETNETESFIKKYHLGVYNRRQNPNTSGMYICNPELSAILLQLQQDKKTIKIQGNIHICQVGDRRER